MFNGMAPISLADIAAVTKDNNDGGFGGNNGWWILIILFALFGWGGNGNGFGNNRSNECCPTYIPVPMGGYGMSNGFGFSEAAVQRGFDNSGVINKLDSIQAGLSSLGYDQLAQMNGINTQILQTGFGLQQGINNVAVGAMQNANALSTQLANCCCENRQGQAQIEFALSQLGCAIQNTMNQNTQAIMQNDNANARSMHDEIFAMRMEDKNETIAMLRQQLNNCDRDSALYALESRLTNTLQPCARPAYLTCNPNTGSWFPCNCGNPFNNGCNNCNNCNNF